MSVMRFVDLTRDDIRENLAVYLAIHADVSPWGANELLFELPGKWELSFAYWDSAPIAYCIISRKFGPPHIHQFMIAPSRRGAGNGAAMLAEAMRRGAATLKVDRINEGAIRFYRRHGWKTDSDQGQYVWMRAERSSRA